MIRSLSILSIFPVLVCGLLSCSQKIIHFTNDLAPFSSYNSFVVVNYKVNTEELSAEGQQIMTQIESLISAEMTRRNYEGTAHDPSLVVRYELISNQRTEIDQVSGPYYLRGGYYSYPRQYFRTRTFLESALLIEITDANTRKLVWQASEDLNKYIKKKNNQEILQNAVTHLFNTYLYKANSKSPDTSLIFE